MITLDVKTNTREQFIDITSKIANIVKENGFKDGILVLFNPHTTAGLTINEGADPSVRADILKKLKQLIPLNDGYSHLEGNSDAHIKASIMGSSLNIIVKNSSLQLGTWQAIYFCEFDGPRYRKLYIDFIAK